VGKESGNGNDNNTRVFPHDEKRRKEWVPKEN